MINQLEKRNLHEIVTSVIVDDDKSKIFRDSMIYGAWVLTWYRTASSTSPLFFDARLPNV